MRVFSWPARVYWEDTDGGAVVYYANYLRFLERARTEWLRSHGYSQQQLAREPGILFTVVNLNVDYRAPARLDDELQVTCEPQLLGAASLRFAQQIFRLAPPQRPAAAAAAAGESQRCLLLQAEVRVACVDAGSLRPQRLPKFLLEAVNG